MNCKLIFAICLAFSAPCALAQVEVDCVSAADTLEKSETTVIEAENAETDSLQHEIIALRVAIERLKTDSATLRTDLNRLETDNKALTRHIGAVDTVLLNLASCYLYLPYHDYEVNKLAIPAFNRVYGKELKEKYAIRLKLLQHYKEHVEGMADFIKKLAHLRKVNPFVKPQEQLDMLKKEAFYEEYRLMPKSENTFFGGMIKELERCLLQKAGFEHLLKQIADCLKTIE